MVQETAHIAQEYSSTDISLICEPAAVQSIPARTGRGSVSLLSGHREAQSRRMILKGAPVALMTTHVLRV
jgi:hypothetical protein